jgi:prolipoprotein diacylglyceryl transferase
MIWNIDPVLLHIGPLEIRYYGVFFALSLLLAYELARKLCTQKKLSTDLLDSLSVYLVIGLIVGARLGHIVFYDLAYYLAHPIEILEVWKGGLASHGAAIGLLIAYGIFLWRHKKLKFFDFADLIVVVACIPVSFIRMGNFFNSELYGRTTNLPWAVTFSRVDDLTRHPSQLYEFGMGMVLFAIMIALWHSKYKTAKPGFFFGVFFMLYFAMRFTVEFFKEFPLHEAFFNLTTGQMLSIPFFVLGAIVVLKSLKR